MGMADKAESLHLVRQNGLLATLYKRVNVTILGNVFRFMDRHFFRDGKNARTLFGVQQERTVQAQDERPADFSEPNEHRKPRYFPTMPHPARFFWPPRPRFEFNGSIPTRQPRAA